MMGQTAGSISFCRKFLYSNAEKGIVMDELIDKEKEKERLNRELKAAQGELARVQGKLNNSGFVAKAPEAVVNAEREKLGKFTEKIAMIEAELAKL